MSAREYSGAVFVRERETVLWPRTELFLHAGDSFDPADFDDLLRHAGDIDILIFGCGERFTLPSVPLQAFFRDHGLSLEWMATGAACRTYNVLAIEGRRVAGIFVPVA